MFLSVSFCIAFSQLHCRFLCRGVFPHAARFSPESRRPVPRRYLSRLDTIRLITVMVNTMANRIRAAAAA